MQIIYNLHNIFYNLLNTFYGKKGYAFYAKDGRTGDCSAKRARKAREESMEVCDESKKRIGCLYGGNVDGTGHRMQR